MIHTTIGRCDPSPRRSRWTAVLLLSAVLLAAALATSAASASAQTPEDLGADIPLEELAAALANAPRPQYLTLGSSLNARVAERGDGITRGEPPPPAWVRVSIQIDTPANVATVAGYLRANGVAQLSTLKGSDATAVKGLISAAVPVALLVPLSEQAGVLRVWEEVPPHKDQQPAARTPAEAHLVADWHTAGYTGRGDRVGLIDDFVGFSTNVAPHLAVPVTSRCWSGDLGARVTTDTDVSVCESGDDHGTMSRWPCSRSRRTSPSTSQTPSI